MATLNDDVEDGLQDLNSDDIITPPKEDTPQYPVTLVADADGILKKNEPSAQDILGSDEVPLPDLKATLVTINQGVTKVFDLKDIEETILEQNAISQEDARLIESAFGGFLGPRLSVKEFTISPTQTNKQLALQYMRTNISKEEIQVITEIQSFFEKPYEDIKRFQSNIENTYVPYIREQIVHLRFKFPDVLKDIQASKNVFVSTGNSVLNILTTPIKQINTDALDFQDLGNVRNSGKDLKASLVLLQSLLENAETAFFLKAVMNATSIFDYLENMDIVHTTDRPNFTLSDFVSMYNSTEIMTKLDELLDTLRTLVESFEKNCLEVKDISGNFDEVTKYILDNGDDIQETSCDIGTLNIIMKNLSSINIAMKPILTYLKYCL